MAELTRKYTHVEHQKRIRRQIDQHVLRIMKELQIIINLQTKLLIEPVDLRRQIDQHVLRIMKELQIIINLQTKLLIEPVDLVE